MDERGRRREGGGKEKCRGKVNRRRKGKKEKTKKERKQGEEEDDRYDRGRDGRCIVSERGPG